MDIINSRCGLISGGDEIVRPAAVIERSRRRNNICRRSDAWEHHARTDCIALALLCKTRIREIAREAERRRRKKEDWRQRERERERHVKLCITSAHVHSGDCLRCGSTVNPPFHGAYYSKIQRTSRESMTARQHLCCVRGKHVPRVLTRR